MALRKIKISWNIITLLTNTCIQQHNQICSLGLQHQRITQLYHLPYWQAFKAFITLYYVHNLSSQATNDDAPTRNLVIILMEIML